MFNVLLGQHRMGPTAGEKCHQLEGRRRVSESEDPWSLLTA